MHLHRISLHLWLLRWKISKGTGPVDFQEFDILMNRCILKGTTMQSNRHTINWIAAVKSKGFSESTGLSGTDSLCPQGCASFQQLRKKLTMVLTEAADNTGFRWLVPCTSNQSRCEKAIHIHSNHPVSVQSRFFKTKHMAGNSVITCISLASPRRLHWSECSCKSITHRSGAIGAYAFICCGQWWLNIQWWWSHVCMCRVNLGAWASITPRGRA